MKTDVLAKKVLAKLAIMEAYMESLEAKNDLLCKKVDKLERQLVVSEPIDPNRTYGLGDVKRILNTGKNTVYELFRTGQLNGRKQSRVSGWKVDGIDLINYIQQKRLKANADLPHAASG